jgi:hypothetical protein
LLLLLVLVRLLLGLVIPLLVSMVCCGITSTSIIAASKILMLQLSVFSAILCLVLQLVVRPMLLFTVASSTIAFISFRHSRV